MNDNLAEKIKDIYSRYHANEISPEQALDELELAFADDNENPKRVFDKDTCEICEQPYPEYCECPSDTECENCLNPEKTEPCIYHD